MPVVQPQPVVRGPAGTAAEAIVNTLTTLHRRPRLLSAAALWAFGLLAMFVLPAPTKLTPERLQRFEDRLAEVDAYLPQQTAAHQRLAAADSDLRAAKVWFWQFKPEQRAKVGGKREVYKAARADARAVDKQAQRLTAAAKKELGLWSDYGISESKALFWRAFDQGKVFARRQTFWDALFGILASHDKHWLQLLIELIIKTVMNFTSGMIVSVFAFLFQLPSLLASYQASFASGLAFFLVAMSAALSVVATFLVAVYATGASAVYATASLAAAQGVRLEAGAAQQRRRLYRGHTHYD